MRNELIPNDGRKSFYGKAYISTDSAGNETLYSYDTPIIKRLVSGDLVRLKSGFMALQHDATPADRAAAYAGTLCR